MTHPGLHHTHHIGIKCSIWPMDGDPQLRLVPSIFHMNQHNNPSTYRTHRITRSSCCQFDNLPNLALVTPLPYISLCPPLPRVFQLCPKPLSLKHSIIAVTWTIIHSIAQGGFSNNGAV